MTKALCSKNIQPLQLATTSGSQNAKTAMRAKRRSEPPQIIRGITQHYEAVLMPVHTWQSQHL
jgi:siderophore synthetase component